MITLTLLLLLLTIAWFATRAANRAAARNGLRRFRTLNASGKRRVPILIPVCNRPHYLAQVIEALSQMDGVDETVLIVSRDGRDPEVRDLVHGIAFTETIVLDHTRPLLGLVRPLWDSEHAITSQIRFLLDFALNRLRMDGAVVLEDDVVPSKDAYRYFLWAFDHILNRAGCMTVTGHNLLSRADREQGFDPRDHPYALVRYRDGGRDAFSGWGWAITHDAWQRVGRPWPLMNWDLRLSQTQHRLGMVSYKPVLARTQHIGMEGINFTETPDNPKWRDMVLSSGVSGYDREPVLLDRDPVPPRVVDTGRAGAPPNERTRNRWRRRVVLAAVSALILLECWLYAFL